MVCDWSLKAASEVECFALSALQSTQVREGVSLLDAQWRVWTELKKKGWDEEKSSPVRDVAKTKLSVVFIVIFMNNRGMRNSLGHGIFFLPCGPSLAFLTGMLGWHDRSHDCQHQELCPRLELNNWMIEDK